jgi:hypothetical protein
MSILRRLAFHHVRKHASWLKMIEVEVGVLRSQYLDRRIGSASSSTPLGNDSAMLREPA